MWLYNDNPISEDELDGYIGFVYIITNLEDNREYVGKKLLKFRKTKRIKGKKKKYLADSDWRNYWGSNKLLVEDVKELGESRFVRRIVRLCTTKGDMNYHEAKYQFELGVLESDHYYNEHIMVRVHKSHLRKVDFLSKSIKLRE